MTSLYLPAMTSQTSLPSIAIQTSTVTAPGGPRDAGDYGAYGEEDNFILTTVQRFWSSFPIPCPPPWKPALLTGVNSSKLGPHVTRVVTNFLAGKCQLHGANPDSRYGHEDEEDFGPNADSQIPDSAGDIRWCDRTCQLAIGCSAVVMAMIIATVALVCFTRVRRPHKMASTRPSRQQLQLSASTSDPINWAEFSNTQIQFDEDMIYPPFRHRGLPAPPSQCHHPSCDPKWNCPTCSSCHPLMRMSPSGTTCSHGYSVVYETIDDDDDDMANTSTLPHRPPDYPANGLFQNCNGHGPVMESPCPNLGPGQPSTPPNDLSRSDRDRDNDRRMAETGFNGDEVTRWPKYFELDNNYDPTLLMQAQPVNRNHQNNMKSFQSPHQDNWGFHPFLATSTFGKSPPPSQVTCNQLCATCVPNIVSMPPCANISRQNGYIPNGKVLNIHPYPQTVMSVSKADNTNNPHLFQPISIPNSRNILEVDNSQMETESPPDEPNLAETRYFLNHGCDYPKRARDLLSDVTQPPLCQIRGRKRLSKDDSQMETVTWQEDLSAHDTDSMASPSRHWCPTCQQVPLLDQHVAQRHSAYGGSDVSSQTHRNSHAMEMTAENQHDHIDNRSSDTRDSNSLDLNTSREDNSSSERPLQNLDYYNGNSMSPHNDSNTWHPSSAPQPMATMDADHAKNDNFEDLRSESHQCPRVLALHSMYFNKTSTA